MRITKVRYFFDFVDGQQQWLNKMAEKGYRLTHCGTLTYHFDPCEPGQYEYAVELVGDKSYGEAQDYKRFLESSGFRTFTKNLNINLSIGKVRWRPWASGMGQVTTSPGSFNKELLILERKKDGQPFNLHTDLQDSLARQRTLRNAYLWGVGCMAALSGLTFLANGPQNAWLWVIRAIAVTFALLWAIPATKTTLRIRQLKDASNTHQ